jgi:5'-nucleotidase
LHKNDFDFRGAAVEAAREGLPAIAFSASGDSTSQVSYTTLDSAPTSALTVSAKIYANLTVNFVKAVLAKTSKPYVPAGTIINVNYPATSSCASVSAFKFVFARALADSAVTDVTTCGSSHLPSESTVVGSGCYASVSVINATNKADVGAATQKIVVDRLGSFLSCLP